MKIKMAIAPLMLALGVLGIQVPALADSAGSPSPVTSPNPGASEVASAYASVNPDTGALAINTTSGSSVFALAFDIKFVTGDTVTPTNLAIAYSSCTACQTVAISIQVVVYENGAHTVAPSNAALAINNLCTLCDTMASAYQLVIGESGPVRLTGQGRQEIGLIREQLVQLQQTPGLTGAQIQARVDSLVGQLLQVLQTELVPIKGDGGDGVVTNEGANSTGVTLISPTPNTRAYSPPPSASPNTSASPSTGPSASPSASAVRVSPTP